VQETKFCIINRQGTDAIGFCGNRLLESFLNLLRGDADGDWFAQFQDTQRIVTPAAETCFRCRQVQHKRQVHLDAEKTNEICIQK
jgi:hypothetical protein